MQRRVRKTMNDKTNDRRKESENERERERERMTEREKKIISIIRNSTVQLEEERINCVHSTVYETILSASVYF